MKKSESLLQEAKEKFPNAVSDVEAVDNFAREIYSGLAAMIDKEMEKYHKLAAKYHELRQLYKELFNDRVEQESNYKKVG